MRLSMVVALTLAFPEITINQLLVPKEKYFFNNKFYYFNIIGVRWDEAYKICEGNGRHLSTPLDAETSRFLSNQITHSLANLHRMWIGGRKKNRTSWLWTHFEKTVNPESISTPWNGKETDDCLTLIPVFIGDQLDATFNGWDCSQLLPFICEDNDYETSIPTLTGVDEIGDKQFFLYNGYATWKGAMSYCYEEGYSLASVESNDEAEMIARIMLKSRPSIEAAWIGGFWDENRWKWIHEGKELEVTNEFPIWLNATYTKSRKRRGGCILLDRHLCENTTFVNIRCDRQRNFICMKRVTNQTMTTLIDELDGRTFYLYIIEVNWNEAVEVCRNEGADVKMLTFRNRNDVNFVMEMMDDPDYSIRHVWVGGRAKFGLWWWTPDGNAEILIPGVSDNNNFPPWCDSSIHPDLQCLNLDRHQNGIPALYGLECSSRQNVICVKDNLS